MLGEAPDTAVGPPGLSAVEVAAGFPIGLGPPSRLPHVTEHPLAALELAVAPFLSKPPCCVAFSGGRDSSLVLAAAVRAAAEHGYDAPVALTIHSRDDVEAHERAWQELVLDHLGVRQHVVFEIDDTFDFVGPVAVEEIRRRGVLYPANSHGFDPLLRHATGGSLLLGLGGDEVLSGHRWTRVNDVLARRRAPTGRDLGRLAVAALPSALRKQALGRRLAFDAPSWLRPAAAEALEPLHREAMNEPVRFDRVVPHAARVRTLVVSLESLDRLSGDVTVVTPFLDPRFLASLSHAGGARGWGGRAAVMHAIADGVLPDAILDRPDKARFAATYFGDATRAFAGEWTGGGVDPQLVDVEALRSAWLQPRPDFRSALLLQLAWLHDHPGDASVD